MRTRIKICGVTGVDAARVAADSGADAVGLVFASSSPRRITPETGAEILFSLPPMVSGVALLVDPTLDEFIEIEESCPAHLTQLHGSEPVKLVEQCGPGVIKSVRFDPGTVDDQLRLWDEIDEVDAILVDGSTGGLGVTLDWRALREALDRIQPVTPIILAEESCPAHLTQLHGSEPVKLVEQCGPGVIKSVRFDPATIDDQLRRWDEIDEVDAILVDGSTGGLGVTLDWRALREALDRIQPVTPIILAGGLTPENVGEAIGVVRPFAVDVSSGVESEPGVKDPSLIRAFCRAVQEADRSLW